MTRVVRNRTVKLETDQTPVNHAYTAQPHETIWS